MDWMGDTLMYIRTSPGGCLVHDPTKWDVRL